MYKINARHCDGKRVRKCLQVIGKITCKIITNDIHNFKRSTSYFSTP